MICAGNLRDRKPMTQDSVIVPVEAARVLPIVQRGFGASLLAVYLHGSAVAGGLRPDSDVDILVVVDRPAAPAVRGDLIAELMTISGRSPARRAGPRPIELIAFQRADLAASAYPARSELVYGEWLRDAFEAGAAPGPVSDPEFTLLLAQARQDARALFGPPPAELLPIISQADVRRAIGDALPALLDTMEGDERNVILTLARMWRTLATGEFVPKDAAAAWAVSRLPAETAQWVAEARQAYLDGGGADRRARPLGVRRAIDALAERVAAEL